jgi:CHAD domain-containing protein
MTIGHLTREEERVLRAIASGADGTHRQRAQAILHWADDPDLGRTVQASGLRLGQVRYWIAAFQRSRLGIFAQTLTARERGQPAVPLRGEPPARASETASAPHAGDAGSGAKKKPRARRPRIRATDPMAEAFCKVLAFHFGRLKKLEGAAFEADEEAVHDMRVSIRRLRAALRIARPFFRRKVLRPLQRDMQTTAQALGAVRDLDVILAHAQKYVEGQPAGEDGLKGWIAALQTRRADAHGALQGHLAAKRFVRFRKNFEAFLAEAKATARPEADSPADAGAASGGLAFAPDGPRVRDVIPVAIWTQYGTVRAYEALSKPSIEELHALRIEIKRFRYLLEFFEGVLGKRSRPMIEFVIRAQDHLGRLHDTWVAAGVLRTHVASEVLSHAGDLAGIAAYLSALQVETETLRTSFPELWKDLSGRVFRLRLAKLLSRV